MNGRPGTGRITTRNDDKMARTFDARKAGFADEFAAFLAEPRGAVETSPRNRRDVIADVRGNGGEAVARYTLQNLTNWCSIRRRLQSDNVDLHRLAHACPDDLKAGRGFRR